MKEMDKSEIELHKALCNFLNCAGDEWTPSKWAEETKRNFGRLSRAYNDWHGWLKENGADPFSRS